VRAAGVLADNALGVSSACTSLADCIVVSLAKSPRRRRRCFKHKHTTIATQPIAATPPTTTITIQVIIVGCCDDIATIGGVRTFPVLLDDDDETSVRICDDVVATGDSKIVPFDNDVDTSVCDCDVTTVGGSKIVPVLLDEDVESLTVRIGADGGGDVCCDTDDIVE